MRPQPVRLLTALTAAVAALALTVSVSASTDPAACTLVPAGDDAADQIGTMLEAVSIAGADDVWAVGSHVIGGVSAPAAEHWGGTRWTMQDLPAPPGPTGISSFYDLEVLAADDIWAVGTWGGNEAMIQHFDGARWSDVALPAIAGSERMLTGIAGTGPDDLWVVGQHRVDDQMRGLVLHGGTGGWQVLADPPEAAVLHDVAMLGPDRPLVAGWSIGAGGFADAYLATLDPAGGWAREVVPAAPGRNVFLIGLAVARPGAAWAVGFSNDSPNGDTPVALRRSDGGWTDVPVSAEGSARLLGVASAGPETVVVGQVASGAATKALALAATPGGGWAAIPGAGEAPPDLLTAVDLADASVWAVGRRIVAGATYGIPSARVYACGS